MSYSNEDDYESAKDTIQLIKLDLYNFDRPSASVLKDFAEVLVYLDEKSQNE